MQGTGLECTTVLEPAARRGDQSFIRAMTPGKYCCVRATYMAVSASASAASSIRRANLKVTDAGHWAGVYDGARAGRAAWRSVVHPSDDAGQILLCEGYLYGGIGLSERCVEHSTGESEGCRCRAPVRSVRR